MKNKNKLYNNQIKEDMLKGGLIDVNKQLKEIGELKQLSNLVQLDDELLVRETELLIKQKQLTNKLNKFLIKGKKYIAKLNKKICDLYLDLDFYQKQPTISGSLYVDITNPMHIKHISKKIQKLTNKVITFGGEPATKEVALNNTKVMAVSKNNANADFNTTLIKDNSANSIGTYNHVNKIKEYQTKESDDTQLKEPSAE